MLSLTHIIGYVQSQQSDILLYASGIGFASNISQHSKSTPENNRRCIGPQKWFKYFVTNVVAMETQANDFGQNPNEADLTLTKLVMSGSTSIFLIGMSAFAFLENTKIKCILYY